MMRIESYVSAVQSLHHAAEALGLDIEILPKGRLDRDPGQKGHPELPRRGGRPKGYRVSVSTRRKLRAAWARRKARIVKAAKGKH